MGHDTPPAPPTHLYTNATLTVSILIKFDSYELCTNYSNFDFCLKALEIFFESFFFSKIMQIPESESEEGGGPWWKSVKSL